MEKIFLKTALVLVLLPAARICLSAQQDTTAVAARADSEQTAGQGEEDGMFNALDYSLQKRFRAKDEPFTSRRFSDNSFVLVYGGAEKLTTRSSSSFSWGGFAKAGYGKWFNPYNAARAVLSFDHKSRNRDRQDIWGYGLDVSHMFSLSRYFWGYKHSRFLEVSTVEGLRYRYSVMGGDGTHSLGVDLGFNFNMNLSRRIDLFVEPLVTFYTDGIDHSGAWNWHRYDIAFSASAGLSYKLHSDSRSHRGRPGQWKKGRAFISVSAGPQFQNSDLVRETMGIGKSLGMHYAFGFGNWFNQYLAFRGTVFFSNDLWAEYADGQQMKCQYYGGRAEVMFDIIPLFKKGEEFPLSVSLAAGPEFGLMNKKDIGENIDRFYFGVTGGLQVKCRVYRFISLFVGPRFSVVPYNVDNKSLDPLRNVGVNYFDSVYNLNAGIEIRL